MYETENEQSTINPTLMQCAHCGHIEAMTSMGDCSICSGELRPQLPQTMDLDVDLAELTEGVTALPVHRVLARYAQCCDVQFTLGENPITPEQVFQPETLMPVIAIEALRIWQSLERRPGSAPLDDDSMQIEFKQVEDGFFEYSAYPPHIGSDLTSTLRMLVFLLAARRVLGMVEGEKIDLIPKISLWENIDWSSDLLPDIPMPADYKGDFHYKEFPNRLRKQKESPWSAAAAPNPFASQGTTNA